MNSSAIALRKNVEFKRVRYWLGIVANAVEQSEDYRSSKEKLKKVPSFFTSIEFIHTHHWKIFILFTIFVNIFMTINYFSFTAVSMMFYIAVGVVHVTDLIFWVDFLTALIEKTMAASKGIEVNTRKTICLMVEGISLLPLSTLYVIFAKKIIEPIFWGLRTLTLIRFYRIPYYFSHLATAGRNHWRIFMVAYVFYLIISVDVFANIYLNRLTQLPAFDIESWDLSVTNRFIVSLYFSGVTIFNVGFGDIVPNSNFDMLACSLAMIIGCSIISGVIMGGLATRFANMEIKREIYRHEYGETMKGLRNSKVDKKVLEKISENWLMIWKYKKSHTTTPFMQILPLSLQKEIHFDINFGLLNRSVIFSRQPRSFLRSVSLVMRNISYLPGDSIMEPYGMAEAMLCIASGVIEILSEENDETTLFSLTTGSILGEATLFISTPIRCIIRASTYVELQVLHKINFAQISLKYPEIVQSMRQEIHYRFNIHDEDDLDDPSDSDFHELSRRKATKRFLQTVRKNKKEHDEKMNEAKAYKTSILGLYVLSENIPKVKTVPINLIKSQPWILSPNSIVIDVWQFFVVVDVAFVIMIYPFLAGFVRVVTPATYVFYFVTEVIYIVDLYVQCTTAIERKDHFTYITSLKGIIGARLKTYGFYLDLLATYDLSVYSDLVGATNTDYAYLLLSLNRILKFWRIIAYFRLVENRLSSNLLLVRTIKYIFYFSIIVIWAAVILYLEACPHESCARNRWFYQLQSREVDQKDPCPCTDWPAIVSLYWATIIVSAVGYGDIKPTTIIDCAVVIFCYTFGIVLVTICTAQASSTFKHLGRDRTNYQEEVFAVDRFMTEHEIPKVLQNKVRNYFRLQWVYDKGYSLKRSTIVEGLPAQQRQIILNEVLKTFLTVPLFRDANSDFLRLVAKFSRVRVLPPDEIVMDKGSIIREMYVLEKGYCEVTADDIIGPNQNKIIGPVNAFGYMEMIMGNPINISVRTVTHARIISLDYSAYMRAVTKYPGVKIEIDTKIEATKNKKKKFDDLFGFQPLNEAQLDEAILAKQRKLLSKAIINVYRYRKHHKASYWEPFQIWGKFRFLQYLLLPFVIVPQGLFIKIWMIIRIISVVILGLIAPVHFSIPFHTKYLSYFIMCFQVFAWFDMYMMFHVGYFDDRGLMMFHPAKTALHYLKGNFILDLLTMFPYYLIVRGAYNRINNTPSLFFDAPGLIMVLQFYKFFQGCYYLENDILRRTETIKILKFIPLAIVSTNLTSGFLILLECFSHEDEMERTNFIFPNRLSAEYLNSIFILCSPNHDFNETSGNYTLFKMYFTTFYWVTSTMTGTGFGDINAQNKTSMIAVMIIVLLGIILYGYMFANLTSTMISVYNSGMKYRRRIRMMTKFMRQKNVSHVIQTRLVLHYEYNWQRTEGASPQQMFTYVHAALRENLVANMYEETIRQVPAFEEIGKSLIRVIGKYLDEIYFLRGETIIKYNDVMEYIYLIYRGTVDILSKNGAHITTMGGGGIFGNITHKPYCLSSVVVTATKNVDLLRLDSALFFRTLQVFPNTKSLISFLTSRTTDYLEPIEGAEIFPEEYVGGKFLRSLSHIDTIPFEMTTMREVRPKLHFSMIDLTSNQYFYLNNSIFKAPKKKFYTCVLLPDSILDKIIGIILFSASYVSVALSIYVFCFQDSSLKMWILMYLTDVIFCIKILLQFNLSYYNKYGDYVVNRKQIRKRYYESKKLIAFDIASNMPIEIIVFVLPENWVFFTLTVLRLNRTLRLRYIFHFYETKFKILMADKRYLELSWLLICISLMIHLFACIWYFVACPLGNCQENTWVEKMNLSQDNRWDAYVVSFYYIIQLLTTTGYGDVPVFSIASMATATVFMILSRFGIVLLTGALAAIINVHSINLFQYQQMINEMKECFQRQNISEYQLTKMWNYLTLLWMKESGKQIPKFLITAPYVMRCEVMSAMFGSHLSQSYVFYQADDSFLRQLAIYLDRFVYFPGNYIVQQGDIDHTMYFIHKGQVSVLTIHPNLIETIHYTLIENDNFGMMQGLYIGKAHPYSYRAETEAEILSLTLSRWQHLLKYFPDVGQKIYHRISNLPEELAAASNNIPQVRKN